MSYPTKITTCCYCGARAALVLDKARHELACASCGAPLHDLKRLPVARDGDRELVRTNKLHSAKPVKAKPKKAKRRKPRWRFKDLVEEAFDLVEDISTELSPEAAEMTRGFTRRSHLRDML